MAREPQIAIVGAGVAGLCMAMQLRRAGVDSFTIFEKSEGVGGTWRNNTYPGSGCDVPSHLYCYSFEPNPAWTRKFAEQHEILAYLQRCADKYELGSHIRFSSEIAQISWGGERWEIVTAEGERFDFDIVITGTGQLNRPAFPRLDGMDRFAGDAFHSACWRDDVDLAGKDVAVVGNGASALQLVPHVANDARNVTIFQRSAHWIVEKPDRPYHEWELWLFRHSPWFGRLHRARIYWALEARFLGFRAGTTMHRIATFIAERELEKVKDAELREKLRPDYAVGCKRILISNDYFDTVQRPNVRIVDAPIVRIEPEGVATDAETAVVDVIIYATGFESTRFLAPIEIVGRGGASLNDIWRDGAEAYLGMAVPEFPNLFMLYGPNTNLGHSSIIFMIECQTRYILKCLAAMKRHNAQSIEVTQIAMDHQNEALQSALAEIVWGEGCENWYRHESGKITNNWSSYTTAYWWRTREPDFSAFVMR